MTEPVPAADTDEPLGFLIHETSHALSQGYSAVMAPLGLTRPQVRVLVWADHVPGITQAELCERLNSSPMAMTGLLDRMEAKDLVKRVEDPKDRRVKRIYLTEGALKLKPDMDVIAARFKKSVRQGLTAADIATAQRVLSTMKSNAIRARELARD
ncbi:MAG: MarR family winged helix-turn-helix transcriptional regulator [Pseudomonadales bacterium]